MLYFNRYDEENPEIWDLFVKYTKIAKNKGFKNYSAKGIFEIIRWHTGNKGNDNFKLNNNYHADYSRKMMSNYPEYDGFFRLREIKTKS